MTPINSGRRRFLRYGAGLGIALSGVGRARSNAGFSENPFTLGVAAGEPMPDGFVIWTRLAPSPKSPDGGMPARDVEVRWEVAEDPRFRRIAREGTAAARTVFAHSVHVEVDGLRPQRPYWYRFSVSGQWQSTVGVARTTPAPGANVTQVRVASVGCQNFEQGYFTAFRHLSLEPDLDAVFHYGDYIYEFGPRGTHPQRRHWNEETKTLADYRLRYSQYKLDPDLQAAHAAAAFIVSFDDHEIVDNWAGAFGKGGTAPEVFAPRRAAALQAWYEHMPVRPGLRPYLSNARCFRAFDFGNLMRMHVLDTRSARSPQQCEDIGMTPEQRTNCKVVDSPQRTMLGARQEAWLDAGLRNQARWNFVAQQVMMMPYDARKDGESAPQPSTDNWNGYPAARRRFTDLIARNRLKNVVVGSGDMHQSVVGYIPTHPDDPSAPPLASEFLATSITSGGSGGLRHPNELHVLDNNPNVAFLNNQRGFHLYTISARQWLTEIKVLDQVDGPHGQLSVSGRFIVDPQAPGPIRA